jgi:hypothetical protein
MPEEAPVIRATPDVWRYICVSFTSRKPGTDKPAFRGCGRADRAIAHAPLAPPRKSICFGRKCIRVSPIIEAGAVPFQNRRPPAPEVLGSNTVGRRIPVCHVQAIPRACAKIFSATQQYSETAPNLG